MEWSPSKSWAALSVGRLVFQLQSLACTPRSATSQLWTTFQDGVRLQYNKSLPSHEPSDHWQALGWIYIHHTVCIISHLHTYDSIWIETLYFQLSNLQRSLVLTHLNPDILIFWLLSFLFQLDALVHIVPSHLKSLWHETQICCIIIAEQWWTWLEWLL